MSILEQTPYLTISPENLIVDYGDHFELVCDSNAINSHEIQWLHDGRLVNGALSRIVRDFQNILTIEYATDEHNGVYQCFSNSSNFLQHVMSMVAIITIRRKLNGLILMLTLMLIAF